MDAFPTLEFGSIERQKRVVFRKTFEKGGELFLKHGALKVKGAFSPEFIKKLYTEYVEKYSNDFQRDDNGEMEVGDKRVMLTIALEGGFNDPEVYANPFIFPLLAHLLQDQIIVGSFGSVVSLMGAAPQRVHRDMPLIFDPGKERDVDGANVLALMPPYAITFIIPLLPITTENGPTRMWLGSHLMSSYKAEGLPYSDPVVETGDAILFDYRLLHGGLANRSNTFRPMLYGVYNRPWFRDCVNFKNQKALMMSDEEYEKVPHKYRSLFEWSR